MIREALEDVGVPAVINGAGSVFGTEPAREWLRLLEALERPASITRAHSAALTAFVGWPAERLAEADEDSWEWEEVHRRLHEWARVLRTRGVASLLETVMRDATEGPGAGRARPGRLHRRAQPDRPAPRRPAPARRRLRGAARPDRADRVAAHPDRRGRGRHRRRGAQPPAGVRRARRCRSSPSTAARAWSSPSSTSRSCGRRATSPTSRRARCSSTTPRPTTSARSTSRWRVRDYARHREQFIREQRGEDLRLAYVALTRARHQAVVWWAGSFDSRDSPLGRLLFARTDSGDVEPSGGSTPSDQAVVNRFRSLAEATGGQGQTSASSAPSWARPTAWRAERTPPAELAVSAFDRSLDLRWRRTSYTDITAASHEEWVTSEPEQPLLADEPPGSAARRTAPPRPPADPPEPAPPIRDEAPLAAGRDARRGRGRHVRAPRHGGDRLRRPRHRRASSPPASPRSRVGAPSTSARSRRWPRGCARCSRPRWARSWATGGCATSRADRLDELGFELPLAGGDQPSGWLTLQRIAAVLRAHLGADDPLAGYAERLDDARLRQSVRGYLTGSLDLVVRISDPAHPDPLDPGPDPARPPRLPSLTTRPTGSAPPTSRSPPALPPRGDGRRDAAPPLRAAGAALRGRAAPVPALAAAGL